jgi:arsenate reductase (thioredoxin)
MRKTRVLFLCTANACRSQMAEGFARKLKGKVIDAFSAGVRPFPVLGEAVQVMKEAGVDISMQYSKHVNELKNLDFDYVITLCASAQEACPVFPGKAKVLHVPFDDPPALAANARTVEEALGHYRRVRDEIRAFILTLPQALKKR